MSARAGAAQLGLEAVSGPPSRSRRLAVAASRAAGPPARRAVPLGSMPARAPAITIRRIASASCARPPERERLGHVIAAHLLGPFERCDRDGDAASAIGATAREQHLVDRPAQDLGRGPPPAAVARRSRLLGGGHAACRRRRSARRRAVWASARGASTRRSNRSSNGPAEPRPVRVQALRPCTCTPGRDRRRGRTGTGSSPRRPCTPRAGARCRPRATPAPRRPRAACAAPRARCG